MQIYNIIDWFIAKDYTPIGVEFRADPQIHWSSSKSGFASRQIGKSSSSHFSDFQLRKSRCNLLSCKQERDLNVINYNNFSGKARKFWQTRNAGRRRSSSSSSLGIGSWQGCGRWGGSWVHVGFASSLSSHWWRGILFDDLVQRSSRFEDVQVQPGNDVHFKCKWFCRCWSLKHYNKFQ